MRMEYVFLASNPLLAAASGLALGGACIYTLGKTR